MLRPILLRNLTRIGHWLDKQARRVAEYARERRLPAHHKIMDGFLLRGVRLHKTYVAQILDTPSFLLFAGGFNLGLGLNVAYTAARVGDRDDFVAPDNENDYQAISTLAEPKAYLIQPLTSPGFAAEFTQASFAPNAQNRYLFEYGYLTAELAQSASGEPFYALDDMDYFTFAQQVGVGCAFTATFVAGVSLTFQGGAPQIGTATESYLNANSLWVKESDLPEGWSFHPRRQVQWDVYTSMVDPYRQRDTPGTVQPGFAIADANTKELTGVDSYCVAARAFKQYIGTYFEAPPEAGYRPPYYDRHGEQALAIMLGTFDRTTYVPGEAAYAGVDSITLILPTDLPIAEIHPAPVTIPGNAWGKPALPNYGRFLIPHSVRADDGYYTFAVYTAELNQSPDPESPDTDLVGTAYALTIVRPDNSVEVLRADWDSGSTAPLVPTAEAGILVVPWIVGATAQDGVGYCLVWEQIYNRRGDGDPEVRGDGGRLVLYTAAGGVTRSILTTEFAPLFASTMARLPTVFDRPPYAADMENAFSTLVNIQGGRLVTAVVATPVGVPSSSTSSTVPAHDVLCLEIDPVALTCQPRGVIEQRSTIYRKAILSAPRPYRPDATPESPAVLLAGCTNHLTANQGAGKTYISYDGGTTWREYVTDVGGQGGAYYVGNKLWWLDVTMPLTIGGTQ